MSDLNEGINWLTRLALFLFIDFFSWNSLKMCLKINSDYRVVFRRLIVIINSFLVCVNSDQINSSQHLVLI